MRKDLLFVPILKNKAMAEPKAIEACSELFSNRVIPYIEIINLDKESRGYIKTENAIDSTLHFEQIFRKDHSLLSEIIKETEKIDKPNTILSIEVTIDELSNEFKLIENFVTSAHNNNHNCAIRIETTSKIELLQKLFNILDANDFLIFDIDDNDFESLSLYFDSINDLEKKNRVLVFSNERPKNSTNKSLASNDYNKSFNISLINSIKNNDFNLDGFGSYCAAKNDLNQGAPYIYDVYGVFVVYNFERNNFYSFKTDKPHQLAESYKIMRSILSNNNELINELFSKTPISLKSINSFLENENKKGSAATYICFSIIHYIEEIVYNLINN